MRLFLRVSWLGSAPLPLYVPDIQPFGKRPVLNLPFFRWGQHRQFYNLLIFRSLHQGRCRTSRVVLKTVYGTGGFSILVPKKSNLWLPPMLAVLPEPAFFRLGVYRGIFADDAAGPKVVGDFFNDIDKFQGVGEF